MPPGGAIISFNEGVQYVSNGCASSVGPPCVDPSSSALTYDVSVPTAGNFYLTTNFTTYHMNQDLYVSVNSAQARCSFFGVGFWCARGCCQIIRLLGLKPSSV
jgi:hypothetical protein